MINCPFFRRALRSAPPVQQKLRRQDAVRIRIWTSEFRIKWGQDRGDDLGWRTRRADRRWSGRAAHMATRKTAVPAIRR